MLKRLHLTAATAGFLTILTFWISTVLAELSGSYSLITTVKQTIPWGFLILVPALAITGATGFSAAGSSSEPRIRAKRHRMPFIAGNGLLILIPAALFLDRLASRGEFGALFYAVQTLELIAGAVNLTLMSLNARDGLRLTGRLMSTETKAQS
jgi:hypothetical protein